MRVSFLPRCRSAAVCPQRASLTGLLSALLILCAAMLLEGCLSSDDSNAPAISGTAATGAPIVGATIVVRDANGQTVSSFTDPSGFYAAQIGNLTPPFVLQLRGGRIAGEPNLVDYYSVAWKNGRVNITPFTDLLVAWLSGNANAAYFASHGAGGNTGVSASAVANAQAGIVGILRTFVTGVNWDSVGHFVTQGFHPNAGWYYDAALERLKTGLAANAATMTWSSLLAQVATTSGNRSVAPTQNTGTNNANNTTPATSASLTASNSAPTTGNGALNATSIVTEPAGGSFTDATRLRLTGTVGTQAFEIQVYYRTATGAVFNVSYAWGASATALNNTAFASAATGSTVAGASVNITTGVATLTNVVLDGAGATLATLNGTVNTGGAGTGTTGSIAGTWKLVITGNAGGVPINETLNNVPIGDIPATESAFGSTAGVFGNSFAISGGGVTVTVSNVTTTYATNVKGVAGDTITGTYAATYTYSGLPVNPGPITVNFTYTYTRES